MAVLIRKKERHRLKDDRGKRDENKGMIGRAREKRHFHLVTVSTIQNHFKNEGSLLAVSL